MRWTLGAIQSLYIVDVLDHVSSSSFLNEVDAELPEPPGNRMRRRRRRRRRIYSYSMIL